MSLMVLAVVAALQAAPAPAADEAQDTRMPFATGWARYAVRMWPDATMRCDSAGSDSAFAAMAVRMCDTFSYGEATPSGDPTLETTYTIRIARGGPGGAEAPAGRGLRVVDIELAVEIAPDGSVSTCRIVRETIEPGNLDNQPGAICDAVMAQGPSFVTAPPEQGPRRGTLYLVNYREGRPET